MQTVGEADVDTHLFQSTEFQWICSSSLGPTDNLHALWAWDEGPRTSTDERNNSHSSHATWAHKTDD
jgi:hypothetical protein